ELARLLDAEDLRHVRMVERRERARLALEPPRALFVLGEGLGQDLDRDLAAELRVLRAVHLPHRARAERSEDRVVREGLAGCERHRSREDSNSSRCPRIWPSP